MVHIGNKIKDVLAKKRISIKEFADKIGITRQYAYHLLEKDDMNLSQLVKISKTLEHDFFQYFRDEERKISVAGHDEEIKRKLTECESRLFTAEKEKSQLFEMNEFLMKRINAK